MGAFQSGFGLGMTAWNSAQAAQERQLERERQAKIDARADWEHSQRVEAANKKSKTEQALIDAAAPRSTMQGTVTSINGQKVFSADPAQAASMRDMLAAEAELRGEAAPVQEQGAAITGNMSKGHQIATGPVDMQKINSPEARNQRITDALMQSGDVKEAMAMENTVLEQRAKRLGLNKAELEWANTQYNQRINNYFSSMRPGEAVAKILSDTNLGGLEGWTVAAVPNKDGKKTDIVATGPNGETKVLESFDEGSKEDVLALRRKLAKVDDVTQIGWLAEQVKTEREQANADRDYGIRLADLEIRANEAKSKQEERALRAEIAQLRASRAGAGSGAGGVSMDGIDKQLSALFTKEDPMSGAKTLDTGAFMAIRQLALRTPQAAAGDSTGAALQAYNAYSAALAKAGGNSAVALQLLNAAMSPQASDQPAEQKSAQAPAGPMTKASAAPQQGGIFRDKNGNIQLMQPLFSLGEARRRMVQEQNEIDASRGF